MNSVSNVSLACDHNGRRENMQLKNDSWVCDGISAMVPILQPADKTCGYEKKGEIFSYISRDKKLVCLMLYSMYMIAHYVKSVSV